MEIKSDIRNELLKRNEIILEIESDSNPSFVDMKKKFSEEFKKPEEQIDVYNIKGKFGRKIFVIKGYVYDSKEDYEKSIQLTKKQRKSEKEKANKPVEEKKEESVEKKTEDKPLEEEQKESEEKLEEEPIKE